MNAPATRTDNHLRLVQFADNVQYDGWSKLVGDWITVLNNSFTSRTATYVDIDANNATVQGNIGCISSVPSIPTAGGMYLLLLTLGMVRLRGKAFRCIVTGNIGLLNLMDVSVLI